VDGVTMGCSAKRPVRQILEFQRGRFGGYLAYDTGRSYRLIYKVLDRQRIILMVVVGDRRRAYGKD